MTSEEQVNPPCPNQNCSGTIEYEYNKTGGPWTGEHCTSCDYGTKRVLCDDPILLDLEHDFDLDDEQKAAVRRLEELREARKAEEQ
jgi:hypothetical protein